jgi:hypothetical protein
MSQNFYAVLGVPETATPEDIKQAARKLSKEWHPDQLGENATAAQRQVSEERFKEISEANATLSNPDKRMKYDRERSAGSANGSGPAQSSGSSPPPQSEWTEQQREAYERFKRPPPRPEPEPSEFEGETFEPEPESPPEPFTPPEPTPGPRKPIKIGRLAFLLTMGLLLGLIIEKNVHPAVMTFQVTAVVFSAMAWSYTRSLATSWGIALLTIMLLILSPKLLAAVSAGTAVLGIAWFVKWWQE